MLPLGSEWRLCRKIGCLEPGAEPAPQNRSSVRLWLERFKNDTMKMGGMRRLVYQERGSLPLSGISDENVIDQIADLLARGLLHIHASTIATRGTSQGPGAGEASVPFPLSGRQPRAPVLSSDAPSVLSTFTSGMDPSIQAAALVAAAASGKPFCPE